MNNTSRPNSNPRTARLKRAASKQNLIGPTDENKQPMASNNVSLDNLKPADVSLSSLSNTLNASTDCSNNNGLVTKSTNLNTTRGTIDESGLLDVTLDDIEQQPNVLKDKTNSNVLSQGDTRNGANQGIRSRAIKSTK